MFSRFRSFLSRHRRKLLITGAVFGGAILLSKYAQKVYRDWHTKETREILDRNRKQQHYESIEKTCNQTALTMSPNLRDAILRVIDTESLVSQLQIGTTDKLSTWEELKILSFVKVTTLVYASSLFVSFLRMQLSLLGGCMFPKEDQNLISSDLQEKYLSLCQFIMGDGAKRLANLVEDKVRLVMAGRSLKEQMTIHDVEQIFWSIHSAIGRDSLNPCHCPSYYLLPAVVNVDGLSKPHADQFNRILLETRDLMATDELNDQILSCVSRGFAIVMDRIADFYVPKESLNGITNAPQPGPSSRPDQFFTANMPKEEFPNVTKIAKPLAKVIPIVNGLAPHIGAKDDIMHSLVTFLIMADNLKIFGANVYEAFSVQ